MNVKSYQLKLKTKSEAMGPSHFFPNTDISFQTQTFRSEYKHFFPSTHISFRTQTIFRSEHKHFYFRTQAFSFRTQALYSERKNFRRTQAFCFTNTCNIVVLHDKSSFSLQAHGFYTLSFCRQVRDGHEL